MKLMFEFPEVTVFALAATDVLATSVGGTTPTETNPTENEFVPGINEGPFVPFN